MISRDFHNWQLAEAFVAGTLEAEELAALQTRLQTDPVFASEFQESVDLLRSLDEGTRQKQFRNMLVSIHKENTAEPAKPGWKVRTIPLRTHYIRTAAVAAGIALLTTLSTFWIVTHNEKKRSSQYSLLKRELETIKRSQSAIIRNIHEPQATPVAPANFSGTGFALTNDGYFVTNYHVTEGADSLYIQNREGQYFKAHLVTFDAKADIAILKVDKRNFRFGKSEVPYTLAAAKKPLGSRVFTLGYPQDEIVYNEGYISSKNGFMGDSIQYRLEIPAVPGQSGAPVMDNAGNVIGVITGKESESSGITYAVSTKAIHRLLASTDIDLKLPRSNKLGKLSREQQIEKMEYYTCSVKVYKK